MCYTPRMEDEPLAIKVARLEERLKALKEAQSVFAKIFLALVFSALAWLAVERFGAS